jgi:hypothetical protein
MDTDEYIFTTLLDKGTKGKDLHARIRADNFLAIPFAAQARKFTNSAINHADSGCYECARKINNIALSIYDILLPLVTDSFGEYLETCLQEAEELDDVWSLCY